MQLFKNTPYGIWSDISNLTEVKQLYLTLMLSIVLIYSYLLPFATLTNTGSHDDQRIFQIAFLLIFSGITLIKTFRKNYLIARNESSLRWFLICFFLLGAASSIAAFSQRHAFYEVSSFLILLVLSICVAKEIAQNCSRHLPLILKICGYGCMLYAFKVLVVYISALIIGIQPSAADFAPGFSNLRFLNHAQTIALPLLVLLFVLDKKDDKVKLTWLLLAGFWWTLLFVTGGRGTFIGLMAGCAVAYLLPQVHARVFFRAMLLTGLVGLAIYAVFFVFIPLACGFEPFGEFFQVAQRTVADPTSGRLDLWRRAIVLIVAHPWLGAGPLHYAHYAIDVQAGAHPHNWILQIGAEWGLPALLCLCIAIGLALRRLLQTAKLIATNDAKNHTILVSWVVIGIAILVDGLFSGLIVMPVSQLLIVLYIGCAAGWSMSFKSASVARLEAASKSRRVLFAALLLISMLALMNGIWPEIRDLIGHEVVSEKGATLFNGTYHPRLWLKGYF
ncbi:MAG: O-antigen ligase family protein [Glaciimonas sp.]|nr:O-antigen ligase family protein [Glaciimonas sp.]